jgi:HlyD family secretion protein
MNGIRFRWRLAFRSARLSLSPTGLRNLTARLREAEANLKSLCAERDETRVILERLVVTAPQDGRVLQINVRPGEYVASTSAVPAILFGETDTLQIRVDVDEVNAPRVRPGAHGVAHPKGDAAKTITLEFERIDPYILPKRSLTGDNSERVDVRVLQVIYRFRPPSFPIYVGQQVDVFIDADADDR